jgi:hypothetical protein
MNRHRRRFGQSIGNKTERTRKFATTMSDMEELKTNRVNDGNVALLGTSPGDPA